MIKCGKCGAVYGKAPNVCFYCGAQGQLGQVEEIDNDKYREEMEKEMAKEAKVKSQDDERE